MIWHQQIHPLRSFLYLDALSGGPWSAQVVVEALEVGVCGFGCGHYPDEVADVSMQGLCPIAQNR